MGALSTRFCLFVKSLIQCRPPLSFLSHPRSFNFLNGIRVYLLSCAKWPFAFFQEMNFVKCLGEC